jgi:hypothetical protein
MLFLFCVGYSELENLHKKKQWQPHLLHHDNCIFFCKRKKMHPALIMVDAIIIHADMDAIVSEK